MLSNIPKISNNNTILDQFDIDNSFLKLFVISRNRKNTNM